LPAARRTPRSEDAERVLIGPLTADGLKVAVRVIPLPEAESDSLRARQLTVIVDLLRRATARSAVTARLEALKAKRPAGHHSDEIAAILDAVPDLRKALRTAIEARLADIWALRRDDHPREDQPTAQPRCDHYAKRRRALRKRLRVPEVAGWAVARGFAQGSSICSRIAQ
jgi:hypothetical protein